MLPNELFEFFAFPITEAKIIPGDWIDLLDGKCRRIDFVCVQQKFDPAHVVLLCDVLSHSKRKIDPMFSTICVLCVRSDIAAIRIIDIKRDLKKLPPLGDAPPAVIHQHDCF